MKYILILVVSFTGSVLISSCGDQSKKTSEPVATTSTADTVKFTADMVDNKRDPSCGMPVSAGIGDTTHYKGKVLGFCSKECKDEFLKDPGKKHCSRRFEKIVVNIVYTVVINL